MRILAQIFSLFVVPWVGMSDEGVIRKNRLEQNDAMASGDVEKAASFWTDDITLRRGLGTAIVGKDAYRALLEPFPNENSLIYVRIPDQIEVSDHWPLAYESGTWTAYRGSLAVISGRYAAQWVKRDGNWFIRAELFVALDCSDDACPYQALP